MKKDSRMLEELRKGPLAGMDEDEFKMIEEDVRKFGFKGLSGYAKSTVQRAIRLMGGEINKAVAQRKAELEKHGDHDQSTHSPTGGAGRNIQDLSPSDQKTFISRMSSAKTGDEQRKIIEEYKPKLPKKAKIDKAKSVSVGDIVSWSASGGTAEGKVLRIERSGRVNVPDSSFNIQGTEDDPAALIVLYRDGKPTDTKVGHKVSTLKKK
jgi:hypothetical protein